MRGKVVDDRAAYSQGYKDGYREAMQSAAEVLREFSKRELDDKPDLAPLKSIGRWMHKAAARFEEISQRALNN